MIEQKLTDWFPKDGSPNWFVLFLLPIFWPILVAMLGIAYVPRVTAILTIGICAIYVGLAINGMFDETLLKFVKTEFLRSYLVGFFLGYVALSQLAAGCLFRKFFPSNTINDRT